MQGAIKISNLKLSCIIGVLPEERSFEQEVFIDLEVRRDFSICVNTDNVDDTVCYVLLADLCVRIAREGKYNLLETYAHKVLESLLEKFDVEWAKIIVKKPGALPSGDYGIVELERKREKESS